MKTDFNSISQRPSTGSNGGESHMTVLFPRDHAPSEILSTFRNLLFVQEKNTWLQRLIISTRILGFGLGPGNIWRFPEQSLTHGNATYVYLYFIYGCLICFSLLIFETSLSQYFDKNFAKLFAIYPIFEGITLAMTIYCVVANFVYSLIATYSIIYLVSSMYSAIPHSYCPEKINNSGCQGTVANISSPEYIYFYDYVERASNLKSGEIYNWRNTFVLVIIWFLIYLAMAFSTINYRWLALIFSIVIFLILLYVAVITSVLTGAKQGLYRMFVPKENDLAHYRTWIYPLEQCLVTMGTGTGPVTTFWTISKIRYWSKVDCFIVNAITYLCSLLSAMIIFNAAGVAAYRQNVTVDTIINWNSDINNNVVITQMFNTMKIGLSQFTLSMYYLMIFISCLYTLSEFTQVVILYINSYISFQKYRKIILLGVCFSLFIFSNMGVIKGGYTMMMSLNENFIATSLLLIVCFETLTMIYGHGLTTFCDDIEFMLGFFPSRYCQTIWLLSPPLFFVLSIISIILKFKNSKNNYDILCTCFIILFILIPILVFVIYKCATGIRETGIRRVLRPRLTNEGRPSYNPSDWDNVNRFS